MELLVERPTTTPKVFEVDLPRSKSISNRVLILDFLEGGGSSISGISESNDTKIVREVLKNFSASEWNVQDAGTAMRFLTSLAVLKNEATIILGTNRMHERPIGHLVECLRAIGAEINYLNEPEFPPLQVKSGELKAANLSLPGHMSSQFISSLLMIAPKVPGGLTIHYPSDQVSSSYIEMTIELMRLFGIEIIHENNLLRIEEQRFHSTRYNIESDWSSASYWFNVALLFPGVTIKLIGLKLDSIQGDSKIADYYRVLGVEVKQKSNSVEILCNQPNLQSLEMNLSSTPDLTQTL
ncbi:MAG: 3-phosphoshikimate 1-carboxyvinyltransferase, partial [Flavobacteriales bacterium]|nr:3-phosphoshikimate 1-carboxyvinyltransferase [Flavobacteriales bacterium]